MNRFTLEEAMRDSFIIGLSDNTLPIDSKVEEIWNLEKQGSVRQMVAGNLLRRRDESSPPLDRLWTVVTRFLSVDISLGSPDGTSKWILMPDSGLFRFRQLQSIYGLDEWVQVLGGINDHGLKQIFKILWIGDGGPEASEYDELAYIGQQFNDVLKQPVPLVGALQRMRDILDVAPPTTETFQTIQHLAQDAIWELER